MQLIMGVYNYFNVCEQRSGSEFYYDSRDTEWPDFFPSFEILSCAPRFFYADAPMTDDAEHSSRNGFL